MDMLSFVLGVIAGVLGTVGTCAGVITLVARLTADDTDADH